MDKLKEKFELCRSGMEDKGLRVNMDKTKILVCHAKPVQSGSQVASGRVVYVVKGVGRKLNSLHSVWEVDTWAKDVVRESVVWKKLQEFQMWKMSKCSCQ